MFTDFDSKSYIGTVIGSVTIIKLLGHGAMGAVFAGFQGSLKRRVAVKILRKAVKETNGTRLRFKEEAETVAVLNHPHIVPIFDMGETDEILFQIMQLVEGEDLREMIRRFSLHPVPSHRLMSTATALSVFLPVLDALVYAHEEGVVHQDIKPANILIDLRSKRPYLADFGIARTDNSESFPSDMVMGTPLYMAPEQLIGELSDQRSDIYSAGLVLFEMLAGLLPAKKTSVEDVIHLKANDPASFLTALPSACGIDSSLEQIILKAVEAKPIDRYQSSRTFQRDLAAYTAKHGRTGEST